MKVIGKAMESVETTDLIGHRIGVDLKFHVLKSIVKPKPSLVMTTGCIG